MGLGLVAQVNSHADSRTILIPQYLSGNFLSSQEEGVTLDCFGNPFARVAIPNEFQVLRAKQIMGEMQEGFSQVSRGLLMDIIQKIPHIYLQEESDVEAVACLSGYSTNHLREARDHVGDWMRNIDTFLPKAIGEMPIATRSGGPMVVNYSANMGPADMAYIMTQVLLSGSTALHRPSSRGAGGFLAIEFIRALRQATIITRDARAVENTMLRSQQVLHIPNGEGKREALMDKLHTKDARYLLFGSSETIDTVAGYLKERHDVPREDVFGLGTGLSSAIVLADANLDHAAREIAKGMTQDAGRQCTSTSIVYVDEIIRNNLLKKIERELRKYNPGFEDGIGVLTKRERALIAKEIGDDSYDGSPRVVPVSLFENASELPGPILYLRSSTPTQLESLIREDLHMAGIKRNLSTALFTKTKGLNPPAHRVLYNRGTHNVDFMKPHQGMYLLERMLG